MDLHPGRSHRACRGRRAVAVRARTARAPPRALPRVPPRAPHARRLPAHRRSRRPGRACARGEGAPTRSGTTAATQASAAHAPAVRAGGRGPARDGTCRRGRDAAGHSRVVGSAGFARCDDRRDHSGGTDPDRCTRACRVPGCRRAPPKPRRRAPVARLARHAPPPAAARLRPRPRMRRASSRRRTPPRRRGGTAKEPARRIGNCSIVTPGPRRPTSHAWSSAACSSTTGDASGALRSFEAYRSGMAGVPLDEEAILGVALSLQKLGRVEEERRAWTALGRRVSRLGPRRSSPSPDWPNSDADA